MKYKIDINIADDHVLLTEGLVEAINTYDGVHVSHTFTRLEQCRQTFKTRRPDVLLLDVSMPDGSGVDFCKEMIETYPLMKIIAISIHDEYTTIQRMMASGAHGYVLKSISVQALVDAISRVYHGEKYISDDVKQIIEKCSSEQIVLTEVEKKIINLLSEGLTNNEIADRICLSTETVNWYRKRLLAKFNVKNTVALVTKAIKQALIRQP